jgi:hypothetical protein
MGWLKFFLTQIDGPLPWTGTSYLAGDNGFDLLSSEVDDPDIPDTPTIAYTGPAGYPTNALSFQTGPFSDPQGAGTYGALRWRIGAITDTGAPDFDPSARRRYEVEAVWLSDEINTFADAIDVPSGVLEVGVTYRARVRMADDTGRWSHWSAPVEFVAGDPDTATLLTDYLRISELMFQPLAGSDFEFVELVNTSAVDDLDLGGVAFTDGISYAFPVGVTLSPGAYILVVAGDPASGFAAFRNYYGLDGSVAIVGPYDGRLRNEGETVRLATAAGGPEILSFGYDNGRGWPLAAEGGGHSLTPLDSAMAAAPGGSLYYGGNWRASTFINGSPGMADPPAARGVVLNEFAAHTDTPNPPPDDSNDWIELFNPTTSTVALDDYYLSDDVADLTKWAIPPGTEIGPGGFLDFDEVNDFHSPTGFGLSKSGEQLLLSYLPGAGGGRVVDATRFKGQENGWGLERYADGADWWFAASPTRGTTNTQPAESLVLNEVMYHPLSDAVGLEFVELHNPTSGSINLWNDVGPWRIDGGVDFTFPAATTVEPGGFILVVGFDPADSVALGAFRGAYGFAGDANAVFGPYPGGLSNRGERVALERPQAPDPPSVDVSWVIVDELIYFEQAPFPTGPDGAGSSLARVSASRSGRDPLNWSAALPSPGASGQLAGGGFIWVLY